MEVEKQEINSTNCNIIWIFESCQVQKSKELEPFIQEQDSKQQSVLIEHNFSEHFRSKPDIIDFHL